MCHVDDVLAVRIVVAILGALVVLATLGSALQTVVVPRAKVTRLTWIHFIWIRQVFNAIANPRRTFAARDRVFSIYAPLALVTMPFMWLTFVIVGFAFIFWGTGVDPFPEAVAISGSSMTTLGFERPDGLAREILAVVEASLGLGLVALLDLVPADDLHRVPAPGASRRRPADADGAAAVAGEDVPAVRVDRLARSRR